MQDLIGYSVEEMKVGQSASFAKTVTEADVALFAGVTGDLNPAHVNQAYAEQTDFKGRVAHGILTAGFISAVLGTKLPGPGSIYLSQTLRFLAPVRIGNTVVATVTVKEIFAKKRRVVLDTVCRIGETVVLEGEATVMAPSRR